jgi:hypothetical protein
VTGYFASVTACTVAHRCAVAHADVRESTALPPAAAFLASPTPRWFGSVDATGSRVDLRSEDPVMKRMLLVFGMVAATLATAHFYVPPQAP